MIAAAWTDADTARAIDLWDDYQRLHDTSDRKGQTVGIDPFGARIWFGKSAIEVVKQRDADGIDCLLYFIRVGHDYYFRKGGRR